VQPVLEQVNLVARDVQAMVAFYERLGVGQGAPSPPPWDAHHVSFAAGESLDFDVDSAAFAGQWDQGWPVGDGGVVLGFRLESGDEVDRVYADLTGAGYIGQQEPYDAFWGARYAVVSDPEGNGVGLMGPSDPERRFDPPEPGSGQHASGG
jgi:catechol 2,3-dioxygenase-like lactoylglutathione lyase family enzyme